MAGDPCPKPVREPKPIIKRQLAYRSAKAKKIEGERRWLVAEILEARPWCEMSVGAAKCTNRSVDVHEYRRRSQGGATVPSQGLGPDDVRALCRECHDLVTQQPLVGAVLGYCELPKKGFLL